MAKKKSYLFMAVIGVTMVTAGCSDEEVERLRSQNESLNENIISLESKLTNSKADLRSKTEEVKNAQVAVKSNIMAFNNLRDAYALQGKSLDTVIQLCGGQSKENRQKIDKIQELMKSLEEHAKAFETASKTLADASKECQERGEMPPTFPPVEFPNPPPDIPLQPTPSPPDPEPDDDENFLKYAAAAAACYFAPNACAGIITALALDLGQSEETVRQRVEEMKQDPKTIDKAINETVRYKIPETGEVVQIAVAKIKRLHAELDAYAGRTAQQIGVDACRKALQEAGVLTGTDFRSRKEKAKVLKLAKALGIGLAEDCVLAIPPAL